MKKRLHIIVATTLFAGMLWISVKLGSTYQVVVSTPLTVTGLPAGTALNAPVPQEVQLRLRGEGWQLAGFLFGSEFQSAVDLQTLIPKQTRITVNDVVDGLGIPVGIQAMEMKPDSISVEYDSIGWKKVPVALDYTTSFRERYGPVGSTIVTPESVLIEGARSVLASIESWPTVRMQFEDLKAPVNTTVSLLESRRYKLVFSPPDVLVHLDVQWYAEKVFAGLSVELTSVPPHREVILVPPRIDLVARGGVDQLSGLSLADFSASLDYIAILSDSSGYLEPEIVAPLGVQVVSTKPDGLRYIVRKRL